VAFYNDTLNYTISGSGTIAGFTQLFKTAGGTLTLNNNNTYTGKTTVTGGILELGGSLATSEIANSAALVYNLSSPQTVSYALTGGGSLTKTGAATLTLQGNKNFGGGVIVNQGTLHINAGGWYTNPFGQTNTVTVNSGGTLSTAYAHSLGVDQNTIVINGGTLALGAENYISNLQMTGGTVSGGELRTWGGTMTFNASSTGAVISSPFSLVGGATLSVDDGSVADDLTISGVIFNGNGITKTGAGTLRLTGVNTYTGATNLNQGTLAINGTSIADATNLVINGGIVAVTGTETVNALFFGSAQQASGTWGATGSGAAHIDDTRFSGTGVVSVTTAPDFSAWAVANAPGQTVSQDHDNDGITNGIEYFMGLSGSAFTANPGVVAGKVSWPKGAAYIGAYGVDYVVQTSPDLSTWTDILVGDPNLSNGSPLEYTLPAATKVFTRLKVTGP
jgi:autotransporter-associated beta strand protein